MSRRRVAVLSGLTLLVAAGVHGSTVQELADLERLQREIALVRNFTTDLQAEHGTARRLGFRYEEVIARLAALESDIDEHIRYTNQAPGWERFGE